MYGVTVLQKGLETLGAVDERLMRGALTRCLPVPSLPQASDWALWVTILHTVAIAQGIFETLRLWFRASLR